MLSLPLPLPCYDIIYMAIDSIFLLVIILSALCIPTSICIILYEDDFLNFLGTKLYLFFFFGIVFLVCKLYTKKYKYTVPITISLLTISILSFAYANN